MRQARLVFRAYSGAHGDRAGNALDGEFRGARPSGDGVPGGDFVARLDFDGRRAFPPRR